MCSFGPLSFWTISYNILDCNIKASCFLLRRFLLSYYDSISDTKILVGTPSLSKSLCSLTNMQIFRASTCPCLLLLTLIIFFLYYVNKKQSNKLSSFSLFGIGSNKCGKRHIHAIKKAKLSM